MAKMATTIPIVDLGNLQACENIAQSPEWVSVAEQIRNGLGSVGFMYLINHGIPDDVVSGIFQQSKNFFELPLDVKRKYSKDTSSATKVFDLDNYFGYTEPGGETLHPESKYEMKEILDWLNSGRGVYPTTELPQLNPTLEELDLQCKSLLKKILRLLALGLKLEDADFFLNCCHHFDAPEKHKGIYNVRLLHYPPIADELPAAPGTVRCGEHSDYGFLTLLFQDDVGGLEVKTVSGEWIEAKPIPGSILVNTGDMTEFWTCGIFPATPHRITIPDVTDERRRKSRYSVAYFNGPDVDSVVRPVDMEKRPCELERLEKNGKVYTKDAVVALDYMMRRIGSQYGY